MTQETTSNRQNKAIKASFQQKSTVVSLIIIVSAALYYLVQALPMRAIALAGTAIPDGYVTLVLTTIAAIIVAQIVLQIVLVIGTDSAAKPTLEERAAAIKARGTTYIVLIVGIMAVIGLFFMGFPAFCMANFAILTLLFAEVVKFAGRLVYYRQSTGTGENNG